MNRKHLIVFIFCVSLFSCENLKQKERLKDGEFLVKGQILNAPSKTIYLEQMKGESFVRLDSSAIDENNFFTISGKTDKPDFYLLRVGEAQPLLVILENNQEVEIKADLQHPIESINVKGSKSTYEYYDFKKKLGHIDSTRKLYEKSLSGILTKDSSINIQNSLIDIDDRREAFVKKYIDSIIPSLAVFNMLNYINPENNLDYLERLSVKLNEKMPGNQYTKMYTDEINSMVAYKKEAERKELNSPVAVGKKAPDFELQDPDGKLIKLSAFKGKYVLLDFWASWCGPCRAENPHVVNLYRKYKDTGKFEILGVSLDREKKPWKDAIEKDGLTWKQVSDLKFWDSKVVPLYHIEGIPSTFLIDESGVIIAKNLRGNLLDKKIQELLK